MANVDTPGLSSGNVNPSTPPETTPDEVRRAEAPTRNLLSPFHMMGDITSLPTLAPAAGALGIKFCQRIGLSPGMSRDPVQTDPAANLRDVRIIPALASR